MDSTLERIDQLMKTQKKQYKELNEFLGMGKSTYDNWKKGISRSYYKHLDKIAIFLGVTPNYLIMGPSNSQETPKDDQLYMAEKELIDLFRKMTKSQMDILLGVARNFTKS